ncbi:MAG: hypothetical protein HDS26_01390 [Bacteroides sp.]|nr:hypothetical protein [Bacteroides sp.]MBD5307015.1 hypothetical protein [Bacteroides sp.]
MKYRKLIFTLVYTVLLGSATACSNTEEPTDDAQQATGADTERTELTMFAKLVKGDMNATLVSSSFKEYEREPGLAEWTEFDPFDMESGHFLVGYSQGIHFPKPIVFKDSECLIEFIPNVSDPTLCYSLLDQYWEAYCQKIQQDYRICIRLPYEYDKFNNMLKLGRRSYTIEADNAEELQLGSYSSRRDKEHKVVCTYTLDASSVIDSDLMLVFDNYEELHQDVLRRLKEAFGEEGDINSVWPAHPNIKFEELEKEMSEMAYDFLYWFAPKPAWR